MRIDRRQFLQAGSGALAAGLAAPAVAQSAYPAKPIKLLVPYVPGSPVDVLARVVSKQMSEALGQPITIENRPGAGAVIATKLVVAAPPDGYTLLMSGQTLTYLSDFYPDIGFDPVKSVTPVATLAGWSHVLVVNPSLPEVREIFDKLIFDPMIDTSEGFARFLALQAQKWPPVIKAANIKPQ